MTLNKLLFTSQADQSIINSLIVQMGWSTNEKAEEKRNKQKAEKQQKAQKKQQQAQRKKWQDGQTQKKMSSQRQKQQKREKELARKRQLKQIADRQEQQLAKINKKKQTFADKKLTQAEIAKNLQERESKIAKSELSSQQKIFYEQNPNRNLEDYEVASNVQQALRILDVGEQKHPEKRYKAAYEAYCAKRDLQIRIQYPKLKRTQRLQMMHKEFQKSPDNPYNKNTVAYNDKTRKQAKKAKEEEKKKEEEEEQKEKVQVKYEDDEN